MGLGIDSKERSRKTEPGKELSIPERWYVHTAKNQYRKFEINIPRKRIV
jgi:hypothetical protein